MERDNEIISYTDWLIHHPHPEDRFTRSMGAEIAKERIVMGFSRDREVEYAGVMWTCNTYHVTHEVVRDGGISWALERYFGPFTGLVIKDLWEDTVSFALTISCAPVTHLRLFLR